MNNPFEFSDDNKRYHTYNYYLKKRFGQKVFKVPLNGDMGCPNRDGTKGRGGCIYCSAKLSGDFAGKPEEDIVTQYNHMREKMHYKWRGGKFIPYFQAGSNTYADVKTLEMLYKTALSLNDAVGISIATRADCIDGEKAKLLGELSGQTYLTVELGLQTVHNKTAEKINRCHSYEDFLEGYNLLRDNGVNVCVHIINGLPDETHEMMLQTAYELSRLDIHMIKIHLLHVLKNTVLGEMFLKGEYTPMEKEDYINTVCDQLEILPKEVIIARLTGDGAKEELLAPMWSRDKKSVMNGIDKELARRGSYQGRLYPNAAD